MGDIGDLFLVTGRTTFTAIIIIPQWILYPKLWELEIEVSDIQRNDLSREDIFTCIDQQV